MRKIGIKTNEFKKVLWVPQSGVCGTLRHVDDSVRVGAMVRRSSPKT